MTSPDDPVQQFEHEKRNFIKSYAQDAEWKKISSQWLEKAFHQKYMYNFSWLGRPIIQLPADIVGFQELVWDVRPDLIIETGIAHGGSLILSASLLAMLEYCEAIEKGKTLDPQKPKRRVLGVDIDIRKHNRDLIEAHPLAGHIEMLEGSSVTTEMITKVKEIAGNYKRVMVCLDSNHTHDHVMSELELYAPLVSKGSYCIVFDTIVEDLPKDTFPNRPWNPGDNPKTALHAYLKKTDLKGVDGQPLNFEIDKDFEQKLLLNVTPDGFLKRV